MDHNLGDSLNLESAIEVKFEHSKDTVVNEADITLEDSSHEVGIPMEFEHIEEQPMLMDTCSEEIIDFMGEQFTLQEYTSHEDQHTIMNTSLETNSQDILTSQSDNMIDLELQQNRTVIKQEHTLPKMISLKTMSPIRSASIKRSEPEVLTTVPRQVAIAPKPPSLVQSPQKPAFVPGKQFAIAPKPITAIPKKNSSFKKVTLTGVMLGNNKGNVLTQIGKQFFMMPGSTQKLKLGTSASGTTLQGIRSNSGEQTIITKNVNTSQTKPIMAKLVVQAQPNAEGTNQPAVITKLAPVSSANAKSPTTHYVTMQQKTVPLALGNKVLLATPTKSGLKFAKKQQIIAAIKSPETTSTATTQGTTTKKVLITSKPPQNVILKTTAPPKGTVTEGQRSQLHQINVPGKGIQYIRLITNSTPVTSSKPKTQAQPVNVPMKTIVFTDNKGNLIQMSAEKVSSGQPPPLVVTGNTGTLNVLTTKQKLMRIAPLAAKTTQSITTSRSAHSLLAPLSPTSEVPQGVLSNIVTEEAENSEPKGALQALVADTLRNDTHPNMQVEVHGHRQDGQPVIGQIEVEITQDMSGECDQSTKCTEHGGTCQCKQPLIVIPPNIMNETDQMNKSGGQSDHDDSQQILNMDADMLNTYQAPKSPQALSENEMVSTDLGIRPRKPCNCTKSQCLKLYCDCFANGEFCNQCNCNNCHNNLENEELRQKAIRGCLERNPNAFRPKIGKSKFGGPEIIRRHNKGCNCKRSGCLKNYCECYEAKIACTVMCKCVGCRNVEDVVERAVRRDSSAPGDRGPRLTYRPRPVALLKSEEKQPCSFMTTDVIEAVCQCLLAAGGETVGEDPVRGVIDEFARCLHDIIHAAHHSTTLAIPEEGPA